jgi:hypothetical protein
MTRAFGKIFWLQPATSNQCPVSRSLLYSLRSIHFLGAFALETHGPLATLWVSIGLGLFYIALIWLNTLLGFFLTPLFIIPATWLTDRMPARRESTPPT